MKKTLAKSFLGLSLMVVMVSASGCIGNSSTTGINVDDGIGTIDTIGVAENTALLCSDGIDNDGNGLTDCKDPACNDTSTEFSPGNTVCAPTESTDLMCSDGKDNDGNGYVDCKDRSCYKTLPCCPAQITDQRYESTKDLCSDGIDNDCDGYTDCSDKSCYDINSGATPEAVAYCAQRLCGDKCSEPESEKNKILDPSKLEPEELSKMLDLCTDGIDNEDVDADGNVIRDGYIDCYDLKCQNIGACPLQLCSDGVDNDMNGYIDCKDNRCTKIELGYNYNYKDKKGIIHKGYTSCTDYNNCAKNGASTDNCEKGKPEDCVKDSSGKEVCTPHCDSTAYCTGKLLGDLSEDSEEACSDGIDNDLDGKIDCDDPDCTGANCQGLEAETGQRDANFTNMTEAEKIEVYKREYRLCTDGIDNDRNGKKDCQEYRCQVLSLTDLSSLEKKYNVKINFDCGL